MRALLVPLAVALFVVCEFSGAAPSYGGTWDQLGPFAPPVVHYRNPKIPVSAGDPSVIYDNVTALYRMVLTCLHVNVNPQVTAICEFTSPDGKTWTPTATVQGIDGLVLPPPRSSGAWDAATEVASIVRVSPTDCRLYYSGIQSGGTLSMTGVATSTDCVSFTRYARNPILRNGPPGSVDANLAQHPAVLRENATLWWMTYTCDPAPGDAANHSSICLARSADGYAWTKLGRILDRVPGNAFMAQGISEAGGFFKHTDGYYYLFFTGHVGGAFSSVSTGLGVARARSMQGPWDINPAPLVKYNTAPWNAGGVITPTVRLEGGTLKMWFNGFNSDFTASAIGYTTGRWPFR